MTRSEHEDDERTGNGGAPEDQPGEPGAAGGSGGSAETLPPVPDEDDDTALGDTDQLSDDPA